MRENLDEKIKLIHNILISVATGTNITPALDKNYSELRCELLNSDFKKLLPTYLKSSLDLKQFWAVIKKLSSTYQGRRDILNNDFLIFESLNNKESLKKYHLKIDTISRGSFSKFNMDKDQLSPFINSYHYGEDFFINGNTINSYDIDSISIMESDQDFEIYKIKAKVELDRQRQNDVNNGFVFVGGYNQEEYIFDNYLENVTDKFILHPLGALKDKQTIKQITKEKGNTLKKIFISHATMDKGIVEEIIDLLETIGVNATQIFCSSFEGYGIPLGNNFLDTIKEELSAEVLVLFVLTKNFYESKVCLCEMGAAWALSKGHIPIVVPPLSYSDIQGVIPLTQGLLINDVSKLNSLKEKLEEIFEIEGKISLNTWERKRKKFITSLNEFI